MWIAGNQEERADPSTHGATRVAVRAQLFYQEAALGAPWVGAPTDLKLVVEVDGGTLQVSALLEMPAFIDVNGSTGSGPIQVLGQVGLSVGVHTFPFVITPRVAMYWPIRAFITTSFASFEVEVTLPVDAPLPNPIAMPRVGEIAFVRASGPGPITQIRKIRSDGSSDCSRNKQRSKPRSKPRSISMSQGNESSSVTAAERVLVITRVFAAPPALVFRAWTDPARMMQWYAPEGMTTPYAESDLRVGGRFRVLMRESDGAEHDVSGEFREIVQDRKLVFTWTWVRSPDETSLVTVEFEPAGDGTRLTLTHEQLPDVAERDSHHGGWSGALNKLGSLVAQPS